MGKKKLTSTVSCALFGALICILSPWAIPFAIPLTAATFAIYTASSSLGTGRGLCAVLIYIAAGAVGLPVFSGFRGGFFVLAGPTGGFIMGYIPCALICGVFADYQLRRGISGNKAVALTSLSMVLGSVALYTAGVLWYMFTAKCGLGQAAAVCVLPFIPGDIIKIALAAPLSVSLRKRLSDILSIS